MSVKSKLDSVYSARFVNLLRKPFDKWDAYSKGIIDTDGNVINKKQDDSWTHFHKMTANIKKLLLKGPRGTSEIASLWLAYKTIREEFNLTGVDSVILEQCPMLESMVSGDAGGSPSNIAAGKNSGAAVYPGPKTLNKNKKVKRMNEVMNFNQFVESCAAHKLKKEEESKEKAKKMQETFKMSFKALGANSIVIEATEEEVKSVEVSGHASRSAIIANELAEAYKEHGKDGVLTYIKEATKLVWKAV